jgi:hypothetical protein
MKIEYKQLENFLKNLKYEDFEKGIKILKGTAQDDIERFNIENIHSENIIKYGEFFLVDALGNDLSIIKLTKRKYKLPTSRVIKGKFIKTIILDCKEIYGSCLNGYWKIPKSFILKDNGEEI